MIRELKRKLENSAANMAGTFLLPPFAFLMRKKDGAKAQTYSNAIRRFASIQTPEQLRKELNYLKTVASEALPHASAFIKEVGGFRGTVSKRLVQDFEKSEKES